MDAAIDLAYEGVSLGSSASVSPAPALQFSDEFTRLVVVAAWHWLVGRAWAEPPRGGRTN